MSLASNRSVMAAAAATFITAGLWFVLAWRTPTSTFHFAPIIAGGVGPYIARATTHARTWATVGPVVVASAVVLGAAIAGLAIGDRLQGPTFWSPDGALTEVLLFSVIGLILGTVLLLMPRQTPGPTEASAGR